MQPILRRTIYSIILILGFTWIFVSADKTGASISGKIPAPQKGFFVPDFELKTSKGETINFPLSAVRLF